MRYFHNVEWNIDTMLDITYEFISVGTVVEPVLGRVYLDVGNRLEPGVLDHHQPGARKECTTKLVMTHPEYVTQQVQCVAESEKIEIVTHENPDIDAVSAVYFATLLVRGENLPHGAAAWVDYAQRIDQGYTALSPQEQITAYSVFLIRLREISETSKAAEAGQRMIEAGSELLAWLLPRLSDDVGPDQIETQMRASGLFDEEIARIESDLWLYQADLVKAQLFEVALPKAEGEGVVWVPGLWVSRPRSVLFKSWARGDRETSGDARGFVFTGIKISDTRFILSVAPGEGVWLNGLRDRLEDQETLGRIRLRQPRNGLTRPGYNSCDPWYDGRETLVEQTIVDSPRSGTILDEMTIWNVFRDYTGGQLRPLYVAGIKSEEHDDPMG